MTASKTTARLAGCLWFMNVATTAFGLAYVRPRLINFAEAALTAGNLMANKPLFRAAVVSNLLASLFLFFFGLLIFKSRRLPFILGIFLILASLGYTLNTFTKLLVPDFYPATFTQIAMLLSAVGGLPLMLWLLIKGATEPRPNGTAVQLAA
jgi:hypothetical protein